MFVLRPHHVALKLLSNSSSQFSWLTLPNTWGHKCPLPRPAERKPFEVNEKMYDFGYEWRGRETGHLGSESKKTGQ